MYCQKWIYSTWENIKNVIIDKDHCIHYFTIGVFSKKFLNFYAFILTNKMRLFIPLVLVKGSASLDCKNNKNKGYSSSLS